MRTNFVAWRQGLKAASSSQGTGALINHTLEVGRKKAPFVHKEQTGAIRQINL